MGEAAPVVVEQVLQAPVDVVWKAITEREQMCRWFFETIEDFEARLGFETRFNVHAEGRDFLHVWTVTEVVREERIVYRWRYEGHAGDSRVVWELSAHPDGTKLTLAHHGWETFPQDDPVFTRASGEAGWDYFIRRRLPAYLEGKGGLSRS